MKDKEKFWSERLSNTTELKCPKCGSKLRKSSGSWITRSFYFCRKCGYSGETSKA